MSNSLNTPIEALEHAYPYRVQRYAVRRGTGGAGTYRGGDGVERELEMLGDARVTILSDRRVSAPYGLEGGETGARGHNSVVKPDGEVVELSGKDSVEVAAGSVVRIHTPGGGVYGSVDAPE